MSIVTTHFVNPLTALAEQLRTEEAENAARQQAEREAAETARRAEAKKQYLINEVRTFAEGFFGAIAKHAKKHSWKPGAIEDVSKYADALLTGADKELPKIDPGLEKVVREKFAYGLALNHRSMPNVMAQNYFLGMRQDWFEELYQLKLTQVR